MPLVYSLFQVPAPSASLLPMLLSMPVIRTSTYTLVAIQTFLTLNSILMTKNPKKLLDEPIIDLPLDCGRFSRSSLAAARRTVSNLGSSAAHCRRLPNLDTFVLVPVSTHCLIPPPFFLGLSCSLLACSRCAVGDVESGSESRLQV